MEATKVGMVGLDTSHCSAFARVLHDREYEYHVPGVEIVAALLFIATESGRVFQDRCIAD